jgi:hypothetical protein
VMDEGKQRWLVPLLVSVGRAFMVASDATRPCCFSLFFYLFFFVVNYILTIDLIPYHSVLKSFTSVLRECNRCGLLNQGPYVHMISRCKEMYIMAALSFTDGTYLRGEVESLI